MSAWFEAPWDGRRPVGIVAAGGARLDVERVLADGRISPCRFVLVTGPNGQQQWVSVCD